jgi:anti-sigma factor RsiW
MCERAREWASLQLDSELSELERSMLRAHTRRCSACAEYVLEIGAITETVRMTVLEPIPHPVVLPYRRSFAWVNRALQAGVATAAVVGITAGLALQVGSRPTPRGLLDQRLPDSAITRGPNSENDALIRAPKLAAIKGEFGVVRQRGLRIDT